MTRTTIEDENAARLRQSTPPSTTEPEGCAPDGPTEVNPAECAISLPFGANLLAIHSVSEITILLGKASGGDGSALNELYRLVYGELRSIATSKMASERCGHTLQPTALVHETFLRLGGPERFKFENRAHFFASAAEAMRRILVDSAKRNGRLKRGGGAERIELDECRIAAPEEDEKLLLVHEVLDTMALEDPVKAEVVKLRYFVGLKHQEIADALGVSEPTVRRHWAVARVRLFEMITELQCRNTSCAGET